jgi:uncharacterized protein
MKNTAHPIDPAVRAQILERLTVIEAEHGVRVLFACESGSRGWGFASPDSDYDVRFMYVHPLSWYLKVTPERDVIELPISELLDINGWELRKALALLKKGNATPIEWLDSPVVYRSDDDFLPLMRDAARETHRAERSFHHYVNMARRNYREYLQGETVRLKKYLYVLRPLLATLWVEQGRGVAPMRFQDLVDVLVRDAELRHAIDHLLVIKRSASEAEHGKPLPAINAFIDSQLQRLEGVMPALTEDVEYAALDRLLMNTVMSGAGSR